LNGLDGTNGFFAGALGAAGDVNNHGYADFLVGSPGAASNNGAAHLYLGSGAPSGLAWNSTASTPARIDLVDIDGAGVRFGGSLSTAGDVNGDGYADFAIGTPLASMQNGVAHLYFGSAAPSATDWNSGSPVRRFDLTDPAGNSAHFGQMCGGGGDINGDGFDEFIVASPQVGAAHVYLGATSPTGTGYNGMSATNRIDLAGPAGSNSDFGDSVSRPY
jgi:hypothetical protein